MTAAQLAATWQKRLAEFEPALRETGKQIASTALKLSKETLSAEVYAVPEDLTKRGQARFAKFRASHRPGQVFVPQKGDRKWRRTGHLRRSEVSEIRGPVEVVIKNTAAYARARHDAGLPGKRNINPARESHWETEMAEKMRPIAIDLWRETIRDVIKQGGR